MLSNLLIYISLSEIVFNINWIIMDDSSSFIDSIRLVIWIGYPDLEVVAIITWLINNFHPIRPNHSFVPIPLISVVINTTYNYNGSNTY